MREQLNLWEEKIPNFFLSVMIVHSVRHQLNTPPPCDDAQQNMLNTG